MSKLQSRNNHVGLLYRVVVNVTKLTKHLKNWELICKVRGDFAEEKRNSLNRERGLVGNGLEKGPQGGPQMNTRGWCSRGGNRDHHSQMRFIDST